MAASGINEHHEALRKQNFVNRQNYLRKQFLEKLKNSPEELKGLHLDRNAFRNTSDTPRGSTDSHSYDLENLRRKYSSAKTEEVTSTIVQIIVAFLLWTALLCFLMERKTIQKHIDYLTYTAKIRGRFSTTNYLQQW